MARPGGWRRERSPRGRARWATLVPSAAAARRTGEWVTEPDPRGPHPATGPARHTRLPFVNNAGRGRLSFDTLGPRPYDRAPLKPPSLRNAPWEEVKKVMVWEAPEFLEVRMDAEINSYQDDFAAI